MIADDRTISVALRTQLPAHAEAHRVIDCALGAIFRNPSREIPLDLGARRWRGTLEPVHQSFEPDAPFSASLGDAQFRMRRRQRVLVSGEQLLVELFAGSQSSVLDADFLF